MSLIKKSSEKIKNLFHKFKNDKDAFLNEINENNIKRRKSTFVDEDSYLNLDPYQKERLLFEMIKSSIERNSNDDFEMEA